MTEDTTRPPRTEPRTEAGRALVEWATNAFPEQLDIWRAHAVAIEDEAASAECAAWLAEGYHRAEAAAPDAGLREALFRVRDLHDSMPWRFVDEDAQHGPVDVCSECADGSLPDRWPCSTRQIVDAALAAYRSSDPSPAHNALYEYQQNVIEKRAAPAGPASIEERLRLQDAALDALAAGPAVDVDAFEEPGFGWHLRVDAPGTYRVARLTSSDPTGEPE